MLGCRLLRGKEAALVMLQFSFNRVWEGVGRRRTVRRQRSGRMWRGCRLEVGDDLRWAGLGLNRSGN
jgi:hypothetical protein